MGLNNSNNRKQTATHPSLETLVDAIDRQVDRVPHPYAAEGFAKVYETRFGKSAKQGQPNIRFLLNGVTLAVPLQNAVEIDYVPEITPLPNLPPWVLGICNLRGDLVSVVDLGQILELTPESADATGKLILIRNATMSTAIIVDKIMGMLFADDSENQLNKPPVTGTALSGFIKGVVDSEQQTVHLLDVDLLMAAIAL